VIDEERIRELCPDAVFERGRNYRSDGRVRHIDRFGETITATVQGSDRYDVTVDLGGRTVDARCTCPYSGAGECKHVVAVLLDAAADPPDDEREPIETLLDDVPADDLRAFVRDALAEHADLRDRFRARFDDATPSTEAYREQIEALFDRHTQDYPVVTGAIDFSRFLDLAEQYRDRDRHLAAAAVYRALFEGIDDNETRIDGAYDHYAKTIRTALDGYVDCVLAADPDPETVDTYAGVLEARAASDPSVNSEQFRRALDDLEAAGSRSGGEESGY
jgi:uncharacterized Zn finger protein